MANTRLFRQEALKHQFKSQDYGEALVQMPASIEKSLAVLLLVLCLSVFTALVMPVSVSSVYSGQASVGNFVPVVSSLPVIVEQHLSNESHQVATGQKLAQVRIPNRGDAVQESVQITAPSPGIYFPLASPGQTLQPLVPIAKLLRQPKAHHYWLTVNTSNELIKGSAISLNRGNYSATGVLVDVKKHISIDESTLNPANASVTKSILVKVTPPYSLTLFAPGQVIQLHMQTTQRNIFKLLG